MISILALQQISELHKKCWTSSMKSLSNVFLHNLKKNKMSLNIFLTQEDAESFFRSQLGSISEAALIQDTDEERPINGPLAWFCKSGGKKYVSRQKGILEDFTSTGFSKSFRTIERGTSFISCGQVYGFGNKGRISHPRIIDATNRLRDACDPRFLRKQKFEERIFRIKHSENGVVINYGLGLFSSRAAAPIIRCLVFQEESDLYDHEIHILEFLKIKENFEFMGNSYYAYSLNNWEMCIAGLPK